MSNPLDDRIALARQILDAHDLDLLAAYLMSNDTDDGRMMRDTQRRLSEMRIRARRLRQEMDD